MLSEGLHGLRSDMNRGLILLQLEMTFRLAEQHQTTLPTEGVRVFRQKEGGDNGRSIRVDGFAASSGVAKLVGRGTFDGPDLASAEGLLRALGNEDQTGHWHDYDKNVRVFLTNTTERSQP